jgi:hypothetical protein
MVPPKARRAEGTGLVEADVAARHDVRGEAHEPHVRASLVVPVLPATGTDRRSPVPVPRCIDALQHRGELIGGDRVHHPLALRLIQGACPAGRSGCAFHAVALVVAIDRAAPAVLHAVHQRGFHPLAAVGEHRVGRDHLGTAWSPPRPANWPGTAHPVIDAEAFGIARRPRPCRPLAPGARSSGCATARSRCARRGAVEPVRRIGGPPDALGRSTSIGASMMMVAGVNPLSSAAA